MDIIRPLLNHYKSINRTGPTIPFIIGATTYVNNTQIEIEEVLTKISKLDIPTSLTFCSTIGAMVVSLNLNLISPATPKISLGNLSVQVKELNWATSLKNISDYMDTIYSDPIKALKYSRISGDWKSFSPDDHKMINRIFKTN